MDAIEGITYSIDFTLADGSVHSVEFVAERGPRGPQGIPGPQGPAGDSYILTNDDKEEIKQGILDSMEQAEDKLL